MNENFQAIDEIWKTLEEDSNFEISNHGHIRNKMTGRYKQPYENEGKLRVNLSGGQRRYIHRLVMKYFGKKNIGTHGIRHLDGNPYNNSIDNLARCIDSNSPRKKYASHIAVVYCEDCAYRKTNPRCASLPPHWYCADGIKA